MLVEEARHTDACKIVASPFLASSLGVASRPSRCIGRFLGWPVRLLFKIRIEERRRMKSAVLLIVLMLAGAFVPVTDGEVKQVRMKIAGYLCGN